MAKELRLSPTMVSRPIQAFDFIKRYVADWGFSPSLSEIANALGISRPSARDIVRQLERRKLINRRPGVARGISLPEHEISEADALLALRRVGWSVNAELRGLTQSPLHDLPRLDHEEDGSG